MKKIGILLLGKFKKEKFKKYKYILLEEFLCKLFLPKILQYIKFKNNYIHLENRVFKILDGYRWDGASGIAIDTKTFMLGSLVHDALYQTIREAQITDIEKKELRKFADGVLYELNKQSGMNVIRNKLVYGAVRIFGGVWNKYGN